LSSFIGILVFCPAYTDLLPVVFDVRKLTRPSTCLVSLPFC